MPSQGYESSVVESVEEMVTCFWSGHSAKLTSQTPQEVTF